MTEDALRAAVQTYFEVASSGDVERYVALFTAAGILEDPVGTPPAQGPTAIRQQISFVNVLFKQLIITPGVIFVGGQQVATHWTGRGTTHKDAVFEFEGIGIFEFDEQGKLRSVREYYDGAVLLPLFSSMEVALPNSGV